LHKCFADFIPSCGGGSSVVQKSNERWRKMGQRMGVCVCGRGGGGGVMFVGVGCWGTLLFTLNFWRCSCHNLFFIILCDYYYGPVSILQPCRYISYMTN
jgi:hypothetical protein